MGSRPFNPHTRLQFLRTPVALGSKKVPRRYNRKKDTCCFPTANLGESTMASSKSVTSRTNDNRIAIMATQTGSTYISEIMINIVVIPTANLGFRPHADKIIKNYPASSSTTGNWNSRRNWKYFYRRNCDRQN